MPAHIWIVDINGKLVLRLSEPLQNVALTPEAALAIGRQLVAQATALIARGAGEQGKRLVH